MNPAIRIAIGIAATCVLCVGQISSKSEEPISHQKSPITLPPSTVFPAGFALQKWENAVPIVDVSLNDSRREQAAIATGLNANVLSPEAAERLKLAIVDGQVKIDALNTSTVSKQAELTHFRASTLDLTKLVFAVADVPKLLSQKPHPDAPAAWLGTPFLSAFQMTIDAGNGSLTLNKSTIPLARPKQASVVKIQLRDGRPYVQLTVQGAVPFWALLDTSSPGTLIPTAVVEKLKLKPVYIPGEDGKPGKAAVVVLPKLSVGKTEWKLARVAYIPTSSGKDYDRQFAVLGMDLISQFKVTIDFARSQMVLSPSIRPVVAPTNPETTP